METNGKASPVEGVVIRPEWRYVRGLVTNREYHRIYRDDKLGVQLEVVTKRRYGMPSGHGKSYPYNDALKLRERSERQA